MNKPIGVLYENGQEIPFIEKANHLVTKKGKDVTKKVLLILRNPWSSESVRFKTKRLDDGSYLFSQHTITFDNLDCKIYGYGVSDERAEKDCMHRIERILMYKEPKH